MTTTTALPAAGTIARFDLDSGDSYIGEIVTIAGGIAYGHVTMQDYSAWYADTDAPHSPKYHDDQVRFAIDPKTHITRF
jgi:hypothetical protein